MAELTEFSIRTEQQLWIFFFLHTVPSTTSFKFTCVLFCQFMLKYLHFDIEIFRLS